MPRKTKKTSTVKPEGTNVARSADFKSNVALALVGFLTLCAVNVKFPGFFSDWRTGGYEPGACFVHKEHPGVIAKIDKVSESNDETLIDYTAVDEDSVDTIQRYKASFVDIYAKQVNCTRFKEQVQAAKLVKLEQRLKNSEENLDHAYTVIGRLNEAVTTLEFRAKRHQ